MVINHTADLFCRG